MKQRKIFITAFDKKRLDELVATARRQGGHGLGDLVGLASELTRAQIVEPSDIPSNVITMNSKVLLRDLDTSEDETYSLVFPGDADVASGAISVLAPIGTGILGYKEGDVVEWPVPAGKRRIKIEKILYQPEAAGDFDR